MPLNGRGGKILDKFPAFMRTERPGKNLSVAARAIGNDLDEAERLLMGVQSAHRLTAAEEERDILRLASLLGLEPADFAILRKLYDKGFFEPAPIVGPDAPSDEEIRLTEYDAYLGELKDWIQRIARILLDGCGTVAALLEGAAILVDAEPVPADPISLEHPDVGLPFGGFIHRLPVRYRMKEDGKWTLKDGYIYLVENPILEKSTEDKERMQREFFKVKRGGFFHGQVTIQVTGVSNRTVKPMVINEKSREGVGYRKALADGQVLLFSRDGKAYLNGSDATADCYYFTGGLIDNPETLLDPVPDPLPDAPTPTPGAVTVSPAGAMDRNFPRPVITPLAELPVTHLHLGESQFRFSVEEGAFDASAFDECVFAFPVVHPPAMPIAITDPSGKVQLKWNEHDPFAVTVLLPVELKSLEADLLDGQDLRVLVRAGLERFRAAGIKLDVDYFEDKWILGSAVLEGVSDPAGTGVDFDATII